MPQSMVPPQPSLCEPQLKPCSAQVFGAQGLQGAPASAPHGPQSIMLPQPSSTHPHETPCWAQFFGVQVAPPQSST
jgi:hypothetical protein